MYMAWLNYNNLCLCMSSFISKGTDSAVITRYLLIKSKNTLLIAINYAAEVLKTERVRAQRLVMLLCEYRDHFTLYIHYIPHYIDNGCNI